MPLSPSDIRAANQTRRQTAATPDQAAPYTVSRLNRETKLLLEAGIPPVWIEAEISNLARPASGHLYFTLKDSKAQIRCAMFRSSVARAGIQPENGQQVLIHGKLSLYEARGDYQLIADRMEPAGEGMLRRAYEQLKSRLEAEGLFDAEHKQDIPLTPQRIGVITSPSGAAVRDVIAVLSRRFPAIEVIIYPAAVQGDEAPTQLIAAIETANQRKEVDLLICGRGGGSLEDLWAFNNEALARAIFASAIPIISAVGHEVDYSIADFVADLRAPTPSAAAELASPEAAEWLEQSVNLYKRLVRSVEQRNQHYAQRVDNLELRLLSRSPQQRLQILRQRIEHAEYKLKQAPTLQLAAQRGRAEKLASRLLAIQPQQKVDRLNARVAPLKLRLSSAVQTQLEQRSRRLAIAAGQLNAVSPLATLDRGYSITQSTDGQVISKVQQAKAGDELAIRVSNGTINAEVVTAQENHNA